MHIKQQHIYLASQSPRRRELLKQIGVNFEMLLLRNDSHREIHVDETPKANENPADYVQRICQLKAQAGWDTLTFRNLPPAPVLAADGLDGCGGVHVGQRYGLVCKAHALERLPSGFHLGDFGHIGH